MEINEKKLQILDAAEKLMAEKGIDKTSVRDIAEKAGVNLAMISYYFGSKEKMLEAMFVQRTSYYRLQLESMVRNHELEPMAKMEKLIDQYIEKMQQHQTFHRILVRAQMVNENPAIKAQIHELKKENQALIRQIIEEGQKKGVFKKQVDLPMLMMTLVGTISQLLTTQHYYREINGLQDMPDEEFQKHSRKKLSIHLKKIFHAILTNEA